VPIAASATRPASPPDCAENSEDLTTTQRYMHLSPAALQSAIELLEGTAKLARPWRNTGGGGNLARKARKYGLKVVEAAGVEPASERPVVAGLYMRVRSFILATGVEERQKEPVTSPSCLAGALRTDAPASLLNGVQFRPAGWPE